MILELHVHIIHCVMSLCITSKSLISLPSAAEGYGPMIKLVCSNSLRSGQLNSVLALYHCLQVGNTPLHLVGTTPAYTKDTALITVMKSLLKAGADPSLRNNVSD